MLLAQEPHLRSCVLGARGRKQCERAEGEPSKRASSLGLMKTHNWVGWTTAQVRQSSSGPGSILHWNMTWGTSLPLSLGFLIYKFRIATSHSYVIVWRPRTNVQWFVCWLKVKLKSQRRGYILPFLSTKWPIEWKKDPVSKSHTSSIHWSIIQCLKTQLPHTTCIDSLVAENPKAALNQEPSSGKWHLRKGHQGWVPPSALLGSVSSWIMMGCR